jgi:hypothetical protein
MAQAKEGGVLSLLEEQIKQVATLVYRAWIRPLQDERIKLILSMRNRFPPVLYKEITGAILITDEGLKVQCAVRDREQNGSMMTIELEPEENSARIIMRRKTNFTNVKDVRLQIANAQIDFSNALYLPKI